MKILFASLFVLSTSAVSVDYETWQKNNTYTKIGDHTKENIKGAESSIGCHREIGDHQSLNISSGGNHHKLQHEIGCH